MTHQLAAANSNLQIILVDVDVGGAAHDLRDDGVCKTLETLAARTDCKAVLVSPRRESCSGKDISILDNCLRVARAALVHDAAFIFEAPVSLTSLWGTTSWKSFEHDVGDHSAVIDQRSLDSARLNGPHNLTRLACDSGTARLLHRNFAGCLCADVHALSAVAQVRALTYSPEMNNLIVATLVARRPAAVHPQRGGGCLARSACRH